MEELLFKSLGAGDALNRREDHQSLRKLTPPEAAHLALIYLDRAVRAQEPIRRFFGCARSVGDAAAAAADTQLVNATRPTIALDAAKKDKSLAENLVRLRAAADETFESR